jgi:hypothetical protein
VHGPGIWRAEHGDHHRPPIDLYAYGVDNRDRIVSISTVLHNADCRGQKRDIRRRGVMDESASRRQFLRNMTALGAASGVSVALAADGAGAQQSLAQAEPAAPAALAADSARGLPRIQLLIGPGTLPSVGKDRMDLLRYRLSGNPRLTGEQMLERLPEIGKVARVEVDKGNPYDQRIVRGPTQARPASRGTVAVTRCGWIGLCAGHQHYRGNLIFSELDRP